jgi:hypothetical protein
MEPGASRLKLWCSGPMCGFLMTNCIIVIRIATPLAVAQAFEPLHTPFPVVSGGALWHSQGGPLPVSAPQGTRAG